MIRKGFMFELGWWFIEIGCIIQVRVHTQILQEKTKPQMIELLAQNPFRRYSVLVFQIFRVCYSQLRQFVFIRLFFCLFFRLPQLLLRALQFLLV